MPDAQKFWFNKAWYDYTGATADEMQDWCWQDFFHADDLARITNGFSESLKNAEPWEDNFLLRRSDGIYSYHLGRSVPIADAHGQMMYWLVYFTLLEQRVPPGSDALLH